MEDNYSPKMAHAQDQVYFQTIEARPGDLDQYGSRSKDNIPDSAAKSVKKKRYIKEKIVYKANGETPTHHKKKYLTNLNPGDSRNQNRKKYTSLE